MNKCKHCDREFHTPQGLGVHTYRAHTARGRKHSARNRVVKSARAISEVTSARVDQTIGVCYCPRCGLNLQPFIVASEL